MQLCAMSDRRLQKRYDRVPIGQWSFFLLCISFPETPVAATAALNVNPNDLDANIWLFVVSYGQEEKYKVLTASQE